MEITPLTISYIVVCVLSVFFCGMSINASYETREKAGTLCLGFFLVSLVFVIIFLGQM